MTVFVCSLHCRTTVYQANVYCSRLFLCVRYIAERQYIRLMYIVPDCFFISIGLVSFVFGPNNFYDNKQQLKKIMTEIEISCRPELVFAPHS